MSGVYSCDSDYQAAVCSFPFLYHHHHHHVLTFTFVKDCKVYYSSKIGTLLKTTTNDSCVFNSFFIIIMDSIIVDLLQLPTYYQLSEPPSFPTASLLPLKRTQHRRQLQWVYGSMQDPVLNMSKTTDQLTFSNTWHSRYTLTMCLYNPLCC